MTLLVARAKLALKLLDQIKDELDSNGVPPWVELEGHDTPSSDTASRVKWFMRRRKSVGIDEIDHRLQQEMERQLMGHEDERDQNEDEEAEEK